PVTITTLKDSVYGDLAGDTDCKVGTIRSEERRGGKASSEWVEGDFSGDAHSNTFTGKAVDNDNTEATDTDTATVSFSDVAPEITVTKTADPTSVPDTVPDVSVTVVHKCALPE